MESNHRVALMADSTCDIPDELVARYDIAIIPCFIIWGEEALRDRVDMQPEEFYRRLDSDPHYPTTAQPTPGDFVAAYERAITEGASEIVVVTVSSAMSGTYHAARQAAERVDIPVHVVDSRGPTMSLGWQVLAAARAREAGGDVAAMLEAADRARKNMVLYVSLDTLEYLHKGGRIGNATRLIGTLLNIKPLIRINHESGLVEDAGQTRTRKRALTTLYDEFFEHLDTSRPLHIAVLHGGALVDAERIAQRIRQQYAPDELLINITGPVLGVHTGPRAVALCGYNE